jgi:hypothetical protein
VSTFTNTAAVLLTFYIAGADINAGAAMVRQAMAAFAGLWRCEGFRASGHPQQQG